MVSEGKLVFTSREDVSISGAVVFTHDSIHPTIPEGHQIYTDTITRSFEKIRELQDHPGRSVHHLPQNPLVPANPWEYATMLSLDSLTDFSAGWSYMTPDDCALVREYNWLFPGTMASSRSWRGYHGAVRGNPYRVIRYRGYLILAD